MILEATSFPKIYYMPYQVLNFSIHWALQNEMSVFLSSKSLKIGQFDAKIGFTSQKHLPQPWRTKTLEFLYMLIFFIWTYALLECICLNGPESLGTAF